MQESHHEMEERNVRPAPPVFVGTPFDFYRKLKIGALKHLHLDRKDT